MVEVYIFPDRNRKEASDAGSIERAKNLLSSDNATTLERALALRFLFQETWKDAMRGSESLK